MSDKIKQIALITGATSGIGAEFARQFAKKGYHLIVTGRRQEKIESVADELRSTFDVPVEVIIAELSDEENRLSIADKIKKTKELYVLVNNAGFSSKKPFHEESIDSLLNMVKVQVETAVLFTHAALPIMLNHQSGIIINVSSLGAFTPLAENATYSGVKIFLKNFSESLHLQYRKNGIKVQALFPGFTRTDMGRSLNFDMHKKKSHVFQHWMSTKAVVNCSMDNLKKNNNVVAIPGKRNQFNYFLSKWVSRKMWYRLADYMQKKMP